MLTTTSKTHSIDSETIRVLRSRILGGPMFTLVPRKLRYDRLADMLPHFAFGLVIMLPQPIIFVSQPQVSLRGLFRRLAH